MFSMLNRIALFFFFSLLSQRKKTWSTDFVSECLIIIYEGGRKTILNNLESKLDNCQRYFVGFPVVVSDDEVYLGN